MNARPNKKAEPQLAVIELWRFKVVLVVLAVLLLGLIAKLVHLHVIEQPFLYEQGEKRTLRIEAQPAVRGMITDRYGKPLAVSTPVMDLWLNPKEIQEESIGKIASALKLNATSLRNKVTQAKKERRGFLYLKRQVQPSIAKSVLALGIQGVYANEDFKRYYPAAEVTAQTLGIVNIDGRGQEGIELAYDNFLQGKPGKRKVVKDVKGNVIKQLEVSAVPEAGQNITLTLDLRLQYLAYRELKAVVNQHKAASGSAVLLDAKTSEVLALVSQPSYNPNNRSTLNPEQMRNRAVADLIEPGSTIKPFVVAAALESGRYAPSTKVNTAPGYIRVKNKTVRDHRNYGELDVTGIITKSSNVGVTKLAHNLGAEEIWRFYTQAGIGQATGVLGFPGEAISQMPYPEQMDSLRLATVAYGYGLSLSPLSLAASYASFTQQGCAKPLVLVKNVVANTDCQSAMSAKTAKQVLAMLETVLSKVGTGSRAQVNGYSAGGKTGTAHRIGKHGYDDDSYTAVFAGIAPIHNPELILVVVIDDPKGREYYGGEVAAPVFSRVMEQALRLRQVVPDNSKIEPLRVAGGRV